MCDSVWKEKKKQKEGTENVTDAEEEMPKVGRHTRRSGGLEFLGINILLNSKHRENTERALISMSISIE